MTSPKRSLTILLTIASALIILSSGLYYISGVRQSLWNKSVTDILEVTKQGSHALDTYIEKDFDTLHLFTSGLAEIPADDQAAIQEQLHIFGDSDTTYVCVDLSTGAAYANLPTALPQASAEQTAQYAALPAQGIREPFLNSATGVRSLGVYERFTFVDGTAGVAQKAPSSASRGRTFFPLLL